MAETQRRDTQTEKAAAPTAAAAEAEFLEVYIRFNNDLEKDYCFQISADTRFRDLLRTFETLPIALRPNLFHKSQPVGFKVSTCPGYLTEDGALLFSYETDDPRFQRTVAWDAKVSDEVWPGQLVLPVWELDHFGHYAFISALLVWLYTDLPDYISPTPGICLTNQLTRGCAKLAFAFGIDKLGYALLDDIADPAGFGAQNIFFVIHIIKLSIIYLFMVSGTFNPVRVFRMPGSQVANDVTKEQLLEIGWTGARRATLDEYKEFYREYKIKEHGGLVRAHTAGIFEKLKNLGVNLGEGEGFNTPLDSKTSLDDLLDDNNEKFTLSYDYIALLGENFAQNVASQPEKLQESVKQFRRYGPLMSNDTIKSIVVRRKALGDASVVSK
ncbi:Piso0_001503 [Millerozyma farinosa CBS 7064]|uniref:Piso0_001503 protein n=1 Tax=Pichia sorbitophila (strain ATCC MYA-4447 / BCRC 22081 / CBS 7064 / NBRC 10061 / NRRL Y-12695) TaxID=559304 RepID=G8YNC3_PICSO|nr:Piso0_001503 [Millerozyma farinosa CBS 7064]